MWRCVEIAKAPLVRRRWGLTHDGSIRRIDSPGTRWWVFSCFERVVCRGPESSLAVWRQNRLPSGFVDRIAMQPVISVANLSKTYATGFRALRNINLAIHRGEIFALLGPNGAGKTTLISIICGIVNPTEGAVSVAGHDIIADYR